MKNNIIFKATGELFTISCELSDINLTVLPTAENELRITFSDSVDPDISFDEGMLKVSCAGRVGILKRKVGEMEILVPDHSFPAINIDCRGGEILIESGIYDRLNFAGDGCTISLKDSSFTQCSLTGSALNVRLSGATIKNALIAKLGEGDLICEGSFAACAECRIKRGNMGLSDFTCKESTLEVESGNVVARLDGDKSDYSLGILAKDGTANMESSTREGAARVFNAYSTRGNIAIEFTKKDIALPGDGGAAREIAQAADGIADASLNAAEEKQAAER